MEYSICADCFSDENIKSIIYSIDKKGHCDCCGKDNVAVVDEDDIVEFIAPYCNLYIAYYFDECEYNSHGGGDLFELVESHELFIDPEKIKGTPCDCMLDVLLDDQSDYLPYTESAMEPSIKNKYSYYLYKGYHEEDIFEKQVKCIAEIYDKIKSYVKFKPIDSTLYRARIGCECKKYGLVPYEGPNIHAAPFKLCPEGRANRSYVSFLYLSENPNTAIHEIRATKGDLVSVGEFKPLREIKIFNLAFPDFLKCIKDDNTKVLEDISFMNYLFSRPTGSSDKYIYLPTQLFVEKLIAEGFEGICFRSSFTDGLNYVIFNPSTFTFEKSELYTVESVQTLFKKYRGI